MIGLPAVYLLAGLLFAAYAALGAGAPRRRWTHVGLFTLVAASFLAGDRIGDLGNGALVVGLAVLGGVQRPAPSPTTSAAETVQRRTEAVRHGDRLFLLALITPVVALTGAVGLKAIRVGGVFLLDPKQATVVSLGLGVVVALAVALPVLRASPLAALQAGRGLMETVGWAALLPQMLAALGAVFALAGVGHAVADLVGRWLPVGNPLGAVIAFTFGMALFTVVMGNAFAAFPVMAAAIGLPLIVRRFHGDAAIMGAVGMLSGFCGTLLTPMAANFNVVPVALLDLPDRWAVIKVQAPTAFALLLFNTALMYALVFRF